MTSQQFVWNNDDESCNEDYSDDDTPVPRKRRKVHDWIKVSTLESLSIAKDFIATQTDFRYFKTYQTESSEIRNYMCRQSKSCSSKWRLVCCNKTLTVEVQKTDANHDHTVRLTRGIDDKLKHEITKLIDLGVSKPNAILNALADMKLEVPHKYQLNSLFHPVSMSLTFGETARDYGFIFKALLEGKDMTYRPKLLLGDASEAITNGFQQVFGEEFLRAYCSFHVMKNADSKQHLVSNKTKWKELREDLTELQLCRSETHFTSASQLFIKKYINDSDTSAFLKYFQEEYLAKRCKWYEGYCIGHPLTNNGLEATNRWIKTQGTFRNKLPVAQMIEFMMNQIRKWSIERDPSNPNCKNLMDYPTINLPIETSAHQWIERKLDVKFRTCTNQEGYINYFIPAAGLPKLKEDDISKYQRMSQRCSWRSFDNYRININRLWMMTFNKLDWKNSKCTCPVYLKRNICKHIFGIATSLKLYDIRPAAKCVPLGTKQKRGRPAKASSALIVD